jgi:hypothetical protein
MVYKAGQVAAPRLVSRLRGLLQGDDHGGEGGCTREPCCDRPPLLRTPLLANPGTEKEDQSQSADNANDYQPRRGSVVAGRFVRGHVGK